MAETTTPAKKLEEMKAELQMLDSKISLIAQKIRMIEKNEDIIGRTIVVHNDKIRKIESGTPVPSAPAAASASGSAAVEASGNLSSELEALKKQVAEIREQMATKQEVSELHYTLDTVNPLDFVTLKQARKLIQEELAKRPA
jgi:prefoldin subunit 5